MTDEPRFETLDQLDALLEQERAALLVGDLDVIPTLLQRKEALFDELAELPAPEAQELQNLQTKALRNQALLDSALRGIRAVADRMSAMRRVARSLETYDAAGRKTTIETRAQRKVERRA